MEGIKYTERVGEDEMTKEKSVTFSTICLYFITHVRTRYYKKAYSVQRAKTKSYAYLGECLHHVRAAPGVRHVGDLGLLLQDQLRVAGNAGTELRRQTQGLVEGVGVQGLKNRQGRANMEIYTKNACDLSNSNYDFRVNNQNTGSNNTAR